MIELVIGGEFGGPEAEHALLLQCEAEGKGGDGFVEAVACWLQNAFLDALRQHILEPGGEQIPLLWGVQTWQIGGQMVIADRATAGKVSTNCRDGGVRRFGKFGLRPIVHEEAV